MSWVRTLETAVNRSAGIDFAAKREYQKEFLVTMSSLTDGAIQVSVAPGIPRLFDLFLDADGTYDLGARCYDVRAKQDADDLFQWHVTAKFTSGERSRYSRANPEKGDDRQNNPNPLERPPIIIWGARKSQKVIERAFKQDNAFVGGQFLTVNNAPVQNSAGDPFDPPVVIEDTLPTLTIIRNEIAYDPNVPIAYHDAINTQPFFGAPQYCAKVEQITARSNLENNLIYWEVTYEFHFTRWNPPVEKGWLLQPKDQGFYTYLADGRHRITDAEGKPGVVPSQLDGKGNQNVDITNPVYLTYHVYPELDFGPLGLN